MLTLVIPAVENDPHVVDGGSLIIDDMEISICNELFYVRRSAVDGGVGIKILSGYLIGIRILSGD